MVQEARLIITIDSREAERRSQALERELQSIQRTGDFATQSTDRLSVATRQLAGYMTGLVTIGAAVSKMDTYTGLNNRLKLVTSSQNELNQALKDTFKIAQATGQAWDGTAQVYQRFADNAKTLGITLKDTASLTETVSKSIAISGGSAVSAEAALVQFGQALASGVLRGEEFNSISEQAPGLLKAIATGLNVNIGELRAMSKEGQLTADVVVKALEKAKTSVDNLFGKTDFTIGQSFTQLSNAVTQFVGEAGKGSGAAKAISGSLSGLAENLEAVTNIAMIGGAYWVGTLIPTMYKSVIATGAKIKATLEEIQVTNAAIVQTQRKAQAEYNAAQAEMTRARDAVIAAEMEVNANRAVIQSEIQRIQASIAATNAAKAQEAQSLSMQYTEQGRAMSISRMATLQQAQASMTAELTVLEQRLASTTVASSATRTAALNAQTAATGRLTAATSGLNVANALTTRSSLGLLAALGGPVGLGLAVAGVAASMLLMRDNTDKATKSLNENGQTVDEIVKKYRELDEAQKRSQLRVETAILNELTKKYEEAGDNLYKYTINLEKYGYVSAEASEKIGALALQYEQGKISAETLASKVNALSGVSDKAKAKIDEQTGAVAKLKDELQKQKNVTEGMISQSSRSTQATEAETKAINAKRIAQEMLTAAQKTASSENLKNQFLINTIQRNGSNKNAVDFANFMASFREANKIPYSQTLSAELLKVAQEQYALEQRRKNLIDGINDSEKERTKELEKQSKLSQRLIGISGNTGIGTGAHLDVRYGGSRDGKKVSKEHLARLQAGGKSLSSYKVSSDYGQRKAPTAGASSFHKGIDFAMPVGTPITTSVAVKDVKTAYDAKGGGYYSTVTFEDGLVLKLLHQAPSVMSKVKGGASDGTYKTTLDLEKQADEVARNQIQLQMGVADEITRIRQNLADNLKEIDKAGYSDEEAKKLRAQYQVQADNDVAIAQQVLRTKLDDYKSFNKTEEQLLRESFARRQFDALHDLELTKSQRQEAVKFLAQQEQQELALIKLSQEQRLFQANQVMYSEMELIKKRYGLERQEIENIKDEKERNALMAASFINQNQSESQVRDNAINDYRGVMGFDESPLVRQFEALQKMRDLDLLGEEAYQKSKLDLTLKYGASYVQSMLGGFASLVDENSKTYAVLFAAQKAFAVAQAMLNIPQAYSKAYDAVVGTPFIGPYIAPAIGAAAAALQVAQAAQIKGVQMQGFATGGHILGSGTKTSDSIPIMASNGEFMMRAAAVDKLGVNAMNYMNRTGELPPQPSFNESRQFDAINSQGSQAKVVVQPQVIVNVPAGYAANQSQDSKGNVTIDIVEKVVKQSWNNLNQANSYESKQMRNNIAAGRVR